MARKQTPEGPQFVRWMPRVLDCLRALGDSARSSEAIDWMGKKFEVSEEERARVNKYKVRHFDNKVAWAKQYLTWEGLLDSSKRGVWALTQTGKATFLTHEEGLAIYRKWAAFHRQRKALKKSDAKPGEAPELEEDDETAPEIQEMAGEDLLEVLLSLTPNGFERICMRMMRESGFEKVEVTGKSHDQGIDGIGILVISRFVTIKVFFQCKRYRGSVGRGQVAEFGRSLEGRAEKGIMITTGTFTSEAVREASRDGATPIELVDGKKLVKIFEDLELGVRPKTVYEVDYSFFEPFKTDGPKPAKQLPSLLGSKRSVPIPPQQPANKQDVVPLVCRRKGAKALGQRTPDGFVIFRESTAVLEESPATLKRSPSLVELRKELVAEGTLVKKNGFYRFTKDATFSSPSAAASVICGGNANGLTEWRTERN